ncbi:MAG: 16S rRNA (guanine(966)-N(2))-methyltransferase RsmD [Fusobacteria bacterium]|nr:16S rRNA (guanine(966)-N(2))-methyltransferase RsmD [Fusobacteriota bacterium]
MRILQGRLKNKEYGSKKGIETTRPTTSLVKEAIFNKMADHIHGAEFLDLYSGTGAIAFEAISRGAERAVMIEKDALALRILIENIIKLEISDICRAYKNESIKAIRVLDRKGAKFDIIFMDPPYEAKVSIETLQALEKSDILKPTGIVVCEHHKFEDMPEELGRFIQYDEKEYGNKRVTYYYQKEVSEVENG